MTAIQAARFPSMQDDVTAMKRATERVDPGHPLLEQSAVVQTFFDRAAAAVRKMASDGAA